MRALIIDDEPLARARLKRLLQASAQFVEIDEAADAAQALLLNQQHLPDVVFLDINLPGKNGLELARVFAIQPTPPAIIFCTAYAEHALAAYDCAPKDYLLKPVSQQSLDKALAKLSLVTRADQRARESDTAKLVYLQGGIKRSLSLSEVCYFRAGDKYVTAVLPTQEILLEESLLALQQRFPNQLLRIHRSLLVHKAHCQALLTRGGKHYMQCQGRPELLEISRRLLSQVKQALA